MDSDVVHRDSIDSAKRLTNVKTNINISLAVGNEQVVTNVSVNRPICFNSLEQSHFISFHSIGSYKDLLPYFREEQNQ